MKSSLTANSADMEMGVHLSTFFRVITLSVLLPLFSPDCAALTLPQEIDTRQPISLAGHLSVLVDPTGRLDIDDVSAGSARDAFRDTPANVHMRFTDAVIWVRFSLDRESEAAAQWFLEASPVWLDELTLYAPEEDGRYSAVRMGDRAPFHQRLVQASTPTFRIAVHTEPRVYFVQFRTHGPATLRLKLWREEALERSNLETAVGLSALSGAVGIMVLMNLVFWFWIRDTLYLWYALFLLSFLTWFLFLSGLGSSLLFPSRPIHADRFSDVALCVFLMVTSLFSIRLLDYRHHWIWGARFLMATVVFYGAAIPFAAFGTFDRVVALVIDLGVLCAAFQTVFVVWLIVGRRQFRYLLPAIALGFTNLVWGGFGVAAAGYFDAPALDLLVEALLPASLVTSLALLNITVASRSREAEKELKREQAHALESALVAKRAMEEKVRQREFVSMVSHEFRTPLAIIDAVAHALGVSPAAADDRVSESASKIRKAVHRLSTLVENVLLDDSIDQQPAQRPSSRFDVREIVNTKETLIPPWQEHRLSVELPAEALVVKGERTRLEIAVRNLVQNAFKYSLPDSPVCVRVSAAPSTVRVDVSNTGLPIPESDKARLFDKYFRGKNPLGRSIPGSGLGLYIARAIARQNGGNLSLLANGPLITFRLELPRCVMAAPAAEPGPSVP